MDRNTLIEKLNKEIAAGRVVTIAGTGVSVAVCGNQGFEGFKVATWTGLLLHGIKHCRDIGVADDDDVKLLTMQVESGKANFLISAAEEISQRMKHKSEGTFRGWLKDTVGGLTVKDRSLVDALVSLPGVLATLNYDHLLEHSTVKRRPVSWLKPDDVQDLLTNRVTDAVLHLHGSYHEPESVVLGLSSYLAVKDDAHAKAVLNLFAIDRTLLFVGCGDTLQDPNFARLIDWGKEALIDVTPRHYLLCRTSEVQDFRKKLVDTPWLQPLAYGSDYGELVPFLRSLVPAGGTIAAASSQPSTRATFDLDAYQQAMRKRYGRLKLEELDPTTHDVRPLTLTGMFISQSARECVEFMPRIFELPKELQRRLREQGELAGSEMDEEVLTQHRRAYLDQSPQPILQVLHSPALRRFVILGDPGSGKSSLLQYLLLDWAEKATPDIAAEPLPLLIELRAYARLRHEGKVDSFLGYLHEGASVRWHFDREQLDVWLKGNPSCILFDGLDEVFDPELRKEVSTAIHRFADEYLLARVIVTSRIIGYQHQAWRDEEFRHFMLQELDLEQIADFLVRWHRAAYEDSGKGDTKRTLLANAIEQSPAIRQLAGNPLLLTMMAILNRTQDLPRDRSELYEQCARLLLHQWKIDTAFATDPELAKASLDYKDKRSLLLSVARAMRSSEHGLAGNLIDEDTLERTLAEGLNGMPNIRPERAARALIEQLRGRNFMLCSVGGRSYAFVHRTFLEYFCAVEIRERFQIEQSLTLDQLKTDIFGHWADETWHEVLSLLAGMVAPKFLREILDWLLTRPDSTELSEHVFLAARCIGEVRRREELGTVERQVFEHTRALVSFDLRRWYDEFSDEAQTVSRIRARAVETVRTIWREAPDTRAWLKARAQDDEDGLVRRSAVEALARGWRDDPDTLPWLKACAQDDADVIVRKTAVQELAHGWKDDPDTLPILKARAQEDGDSTVRQSTVEALARGWRDDPDTLPWLKACAQDDADASIRATAVRELAHGWKDDPDTLALLKAHALHAAEYELRLTAVQELVFGWKDSPDIPSILKAAVRFDDSPIVLRTAVHELARGWKEDPDTLPWLKACVQHDAQAIVRATALGELASGWRDDPDTLPWLKASAQGDTDKEVRKTALRELAWGWKDDSDTLPILKARAQDDADGRVRATAVRELAHGWKDDPDTLPILKARAQDDGDSTVRQSTVEALAGGWRDDPDTLLWLKACAQDDADGRVRATAVRELAHGWKDDPDTLAFLKARAQDNTHRQVRQSALQELVHGWKHDPDTLVLLKACIERDANEEERRAALQGQPNRWKDSSDIESWLKAYEQQDADARERVSALRTLARGWKDDPDTLAFLKARAQDNSHWKVRQNALEELARGWNSDPEVQTILSTFKNEM